MPNIKKSCVRCGQLVDIKSMSAHVRQCENQVPYAFSVPPVLGLTTENLVW